MNKIESSIKFRLKDCLIIEKGPFKKWVCNQGLEEYEKFMFNEYGKVIDKSKIKLNTIDVYI
jgi:hypothetical protein